VKKHAIRKGNENIEILMKRKHWIENIGLKLFINTHANNEAISNYVREKYSIEIQVLEARHFCTEKEKR